jgi:D-arabinose 1-dehydrogenase-like Zn-dependent alcohol dehydrogenase
MARIRALCYRSFGELPELVDILRPRCPDTGVVIEVAATGLCRSDWHAWMGHDPEVKLPHVPGHEFAGVVAEVGSAVHDWRPGDRVTVPFVCACGTCETCLRGEQQVCERQFQPGFTHWGSFAEAVAIDRADVNLVRVPATMDLETAASLGCRFSTAYRAVTHHGRVERDDWVVVHGCGGVGLSALMICVARDAKVIAVDVSPPALALARRLGAVATLDAGDTDIVGAVRELTGGGAQVSIDALGSVATCQNSIASLRRRGRHVQVGLMLAEDDMPPVPMSRVIADELELYGSHGMAAHDYPAMLAEISDGSLQPQRLVAHRIPLSEAAAALAGMGQRPGDGITMIIP